MEKMNITYRTLQPEEICRALFAQFIRRQVVTQCWRKVDGGWCVQDAPFIDDWSEADYAVLVDCLCRTARTGGLVLAAFADGALKGFCSVEAEPIGARGQYRDLTSIHISEDMRGRGIGRALFSEAKAWAKAQGADRLYISAHSAVESQSFYRAMGCVEAEEIQQKHVDAEPFDCQLECAVD